MNNFIVILFLIPILSLVLLAIILLFSNVNPDEAKVIPFECGFNSLTDQTRTIFYIHFFIFALLFLIFDLKIAILFPFAVTLYFLLVVMDFIRYFIFNFINLFFLFKKFICFSLALAELPMLLFLSEERLASLE